MAPCWLSFLVAWGLPLAWWVWCVVFGEVHCCYSYVTIFMSKGLHIPSLWARFLVLNAFGVGWFGLLSQKEKEKESFPCCAVMIDYLLLTKLRYK